MLGFTVVQNTKFVLILSSKSVSGGVSLVEFSPYLFMCRCPIVVFLNFSRCFFMSYLVKPGHIFRKPCLIDLRRLDVVGLKSSACKYWYSSGFEVCVRMFCTTFYDCCVRRGTSYITVLLFLFPLIISSPLLWMEISCMSSVMVHPSSHKLLMILMGLYAFWENVYLPHLLD